MRRILSVLLENESGALSRVIGLFSQRGYNIESLTVAPTDDPTLSRMTIQTVGDEKVLEQIEKQRNLASAQNDLNRFKELDTQWRALKAALEPAAPK